VLLDSDVLTEGPTEAVAHIGSSDYSLGAINSLGPVGNWGSPEKVDTVQLASGVAFSECS
jgi:hypothetical protein